MLATILAPLIAVLFMAVVSFWLQGHPRLGSALATLGLTIVAIISALAIAFSIAEGESLTPALSAFGPVLAFSGLLLWFRRWGLRGFPRRRRPPVSHLDASPAEVPPGPLVRRRNLAYLLKIWVVAGLVIAGVSFLFGSAVYRGVQAGDYAGLWPLAVGILGTGWTLMHVRRRVRQQAAQIPRLLQQSAPDELAAHFKTSFSRVPNGDACGAQLAGTVYAYYGEFDRARAELQSIDWSSRPPLVASGELALRALLAFLEELDAMRGLALARQANELARVPHAYPQAKTLDRAYDIYIKIGEALTAPGHTAQAAIAALERYFDTHPVLDKVTAAWGLAQAYGRLGQPAKAEEKLSFIGAAAPYCKALTILAEPAARSSTDPASLDG